MTRSQKRKTGSVIYGVFIVLYVLLLAVVICVVLGKTWTFAKDYENARPDPVIEEYMNELRANQYNDGIGATVAAMNNGVQSDEEVKAQVQRMLRGNLDYRRASGSDGEKEIKYDLICNKEKFGTVTLVRDDGSRKDAKFVVPFFKWEFDLRPWKVGQEEFYLEGIYNSLTVTVPRMYKVSINGVELGEENIVERDIPYDVLKDYYKFYPDLPTKVTYRFDNMVGSVEPVITDENGNEVEIDYSKDDWQFIEQPSSAEMARLGTFATELADRFMAFGAGVSGFWTCYNNLLPYLEPDGELAERLKLAQDGYDNWSHTASYQFNGATLNSALAVGDGYYILDVTAETTIIYANKGDNGVVHEFNGLTVIAHDDGEKVYAVTVERY